MHSIRSVDSVYDGYSGYSGYSSSMDPFSGVNPGILLAVVVISLIITIVVFVLLVEKKKAPRSRFLKWLREFLNFRSILIAVLIKFVYLFLAVLTTIMGIVTMFTGKDETVLPMIGAGLALIIFGNVFLRLIMEGIMIMIGLWENTKDIRAVLVKNEEMPEEKEPRDKDGSKEKELKEEEVKKDSVEPAVVLPEEPKVEMPAESVAQLSVESAPQPSVEPMPEQNVSQAADAVEVVETKNMIVDNSQL